MWFFSIESWIKKFVFLTVAVKNCIFLNVEYRNTQFFFSNTKKMCLDVHFTGWWCWWGRFSAQNSCSCSHGWLVLFCRNILDYWKFLTFHFQAKILVYASVGSFDIFVYVVAGKKKEDFAYIFGPKSRSRSQQNTT